MIVAHLSNHDGCLADFEYVGRELGLEVRSFRFDDGYNIGPERSRRAWGRWRERLASADVVLVSDTTPLARIVLERLEELRGHVVVWVCNRFDYSDQATNDCGFPDPAYYELIRRSAGHERVHIAPNTAFEIEYARAKGVELGSRVIKPLGRRLSARREPRLPPELDRAATVFVPPYHNDTLLLDLADICRQGGAVAYTGRYGGPDDLRGFRAIVHIPYSWSTFAFFESLQNAIPLVVPSPRFLLELARDANFWWPDQVHLERLLAVSEWYDPDHTFLVHFDDWPDLWRQLEHADLEGARTEMRTFARAHEQRCLAAWAGLLGVRQPEAVTAGR